MYVENCAKHEKNWIELLRKENWELVPTLKRKDHHVMVYLHVCCSQRVLWLKLIQNINISSNISSWYNTHLWWTRANSYMPIFRGLTCFNSWTTMQKTKQMDDELLTGWAILSLSLKKLLCNCVCMSHCNLLYIHL
jgi:hypothetical protein